MNKKRIVLCVMIMFAMLCTSVYATIMGDINLRSSSEFVTPGEEFQVTVSIKDVNIKDGIDSIEGYINIDENVIEGLTVDNIVSDNGMVKIGDNELKVIDPNTVDILPEKAVIFNNKPIRKDGDYRLVIELGKCIPTDTDLLTINFKVKPGVDPKAYKDVISYDLFVLFNKELEQATEVISKTIDIDVREKEVVKPNTNVNTNINNSINTNQNTNTNSNLNKNTNTNTNTNKNTNTNTNKNVINKNTNTNINTNKNVINKNTNTNKNTNKNVINKNTNTNKNVINKNVNKNVDNTISNEKLPNAGYRIVLLPILAISIMGLIFYSKYTKYNQQ